MKPRPILLVEDNLDDVELTKRAFTRSNILNELLVAEDGEQALEYLFSAPQPGRPHPDPVMILLDIKLPDMSGLEVLDRIRADQRTKNTPVIILTSSREELDVKSGYDRGANSFIRKPVAFEDFVNVVQQVGMYWLVLNEPVPESSAVEE